MKGISFQNGIEYKLVIEGESWAQGATITGKMEAVSRGSGPLPSTISVALGDALDRKVKAKAADAFEILEKIDSKEMSLDWKFKLPLDIPVTDKLGGVYALYGNTAAPENFGQLRLNILPHQHIRDLIEILNTHFRFALKGVAAGKKGFVEAKLDPPPIKDWASLELLILSAKMTEETLEVKMQFHRNVVNSLGGGVTSKLVKKEFERSWDLTKIVHEFNQRLNKDITTLAIEQVIEEYNQVSWLSTEENPS